MSCQSCPALISTFNSLLSSELYVFIRHLVLVLDGGWHVGIWIIETGRTRGVLVTLVLYLVRQQETHTETVWSDLAWQSALPLCPLFQTTQPDTHRWACTSELTLGPGFTVRYGGRMCRGDRQRMMWSDISWEISEHKQRSVYSDTS